MHAIRCLPFLNVPSARSESSVPPRHADEPGLISGTPVDDDRGDTLWSEFPTPLAIPLPLDGAIDGEAMLPVCYEANYAYPLLVWLEPGDEVGFRERVAAVSDRNYLGLSIQSPHLRDAVPRSIPLVTAGAGLVQSAVQFVQSIWNVHAGRRVLIAEGKSHCDWAARLMLHSPDQFDALVLIDPGPSTTRDVIRSGRSESAPKPVLIASTSIGEVEGREWLQIGKRLGWEIDLATDREAVCKPRLPELLNFWLMSRVVASLGK